MNRYIRNKKMSNSNTNSASTGTNNNSNTTTDPGVNTPTSVLGEVSNSGYSNTIYGNPVLQPYQDTKKSQIPILNNTNNVIKSYIALNPKFYDMARQMAVKSFVCAFCELITNSVDAYRKSPNPIYPFPINITVDRTQNMIQVSDQAVGMSAQTLKDCILQVGSSADSSEGIRGMMGRGAKDISILGDTYFYTIKDGLFSSCTIDRNAMQAMIDNGIPATDQLRQQYNIPVNGTVVQIFLSDLNTLPESPTLYFVLSRDYLLRNLFSDANIACTLTVLGDTPNIYTNTPVIYTFPTGVEVLETSFNVPNYPQYTATFTLYKTPLPLSDTGDERTNEFGILVTGDGDVVYESSCLNPVFRGYKQMKYIYGQLYCPGIRDLMLQAIAGNLTQANPSLIVDPARNEVLNRKHPFVKALLQIPLQWLEIVLNQVQDRLNTDQLVSQDFEDITNQIADLGENFIKDNLFQFTWRSKRDDEILQQMNLPLQSLNVNQDVIQMSDQMIDAIKNGDTSYSRSSDFTSMNTDPTTGPKLKISYVNTPQELTSYQITTYNGTANLQINVAHPSLNQFLQLSNPTPELLATAKPNSKLRVDEPITTPVTPAPILTMTNQGKGTYSIAPVVTNAFTYLMTRDFMINNPDHFANASTATDIFNAYNEVSKNSEGSISPTVYSRFYSIISTQQTKKQKTTSTTTTS